MNAPNLRNDWILHAYADGELEPEDRRGVDQQLASEHDARADIEAWRRQKEALKATYARVLEEEIPPGIKAALRTRGPWQVREWQKLAAAIAVLAGLAVAYFSYSEVIVPNSAGEEIAANALSAHVVFTAEVKHPVEVAASEKDQLVAWLSKRIGHKISAPDLSAKGFELVGGRLLPEDGLPAAQFMYEDAAKHRLTVYIAHNPSNRETAFRINEHGAYTTCYWLDGESGYAVAAELPADEMLPIAHIVYDSLEKDG